MSIQKSIYLALLVDNENNRSLCIASVLQDTWDNHSLMDDPDEIEDIVGQIQIPGYKLESSGMDYSLLDIISLASDQEDTMLDESHYATLKSAILKEGYIINQELAEHIRTSSEGIYEPV